MFEPDEMAAFREQMRAAKHFVDGYVVLGKRPQDNAYQGIVEHSFCMALDEKSVRVWRIRPDGWEGVSEATELCREYNISHASEGMVFEVFDIDSPDCPVLLNWKWYSVMHNPEKSSRYKFWTRNLMFEQK